MTRPILTLALLAALLGSFFLGRGYEHLRMRSRLDNAWRIVNQQASGIAKHFEKYHGLRGVEIDEEGEMVTGRAVEGR